MSALGDAIRAKDLEAAWGEAARLGPAAAPELAALAQDPDPEVRALSVETLAVARGPAAARALLAALPDPELAVSAAAAKGLEALATPDLAPDLLVAFDATPEWMVRRPLALLLGRLEGWDPALLRKRVDREPSPDVREAMIVALARRGEPEARAELARWIAEAEPADSPRMVDHARYVSQPWLLPALAPRLDDWTPAVRLVEGLPGPEHLRVCDVVVDLVAALSGQAFAGVPKPLTNYDLAVIDEVKAYLATLPAAPPSQPAP